MVHYNKYEIIYQVYPKMPNHKKHYKDKSTYLYFGLDASNYNTSVELRGSVLIQYNQKSNIEFPSQLIKRKTYSL